MDFTTQDWYDETKTAQENYKAFQEAQKEEYSLGDFFGTKELDMEAYTVLKIEAEQEKAKIAKFNKAKEEAFNELAKKHDAERIALGKEWQVYEDNDYNYEVPK